MGLKNWTEALAADLKLAIRTLHNNPGFAMAVIVTVGLGVGANTAVFSVVDAILLRPLPYSRPDRLLGIDHYVPQFERALDSWPADQATTLRRAASPVTTLTLYGRLSMTRTEGEEPVRVSGHAVSVDWLSTLGVRPAEGRGFLPDDARPGAPAVTVVSHAFWQTQLGSDLNVVGRPLELDGASYTVVGVMAPEFKFPPLGPNDLWLPLAADGTAAGRAVRSLSIVTRAAAGELVTTMQDRLSAVSVGLQKSDPRPRGWQAEVRGFDRFRANRDVEAALWVLSGAVGLMLLIAAVNAANLILARGTTRRMEISLRRALGASRLRLVRYLMTETLLVVGLGSVLALLLARAALGAIEGLLPSEVTFFLTSGIRLDHRVLLFALGLTALTGVGVGLFPAWRAIVGAGDRPAGRTASGGLGSNRLRSGLVVAEVSLSLALLLGAGLLVNSFIRLTSVDPGYEADRVAQLTVDLPRRSYGDEAARADFQARFKERVAALPGVEAVAITFGDPAGGGSITFGVSPQAEGQAPKSPGDQDFLPSISADADFFRVLGVPLLAGRGLQPADTRKSGAVVIDHDFSRFLFGNANPVGRRFRLDQDGQWLTVVGVVGDFKLWGQDDRRARYDFFRPLAGPPALMSLLARTTADPELLLPRLRMILRELDPELPAIEITTAGRALSARNDKPRFFLTLMAGFAVTALVLAAVGTYGVLAFSVRQRQRELGIRMALGAAAAQVRRLVLRQGLLLVGTGLVTGLAAALALQRLIEGLLFGIEPNDPTTYVVVVAAMLGVGAIACAIPARRATKVNPVEVLRTE